MLIDAGLGQYAQIVHNYIAALVVGGAPIPALDHIVLTHYEADHGRGLLGLLQADDMNQIVQTLTTVGSANALGGSQPKQIAGVAAAVCCAALGGYGAANAGVASTMAINARNNTGNIDTHQKAIDNGVSEAERNGPVAGARTLIDAAGTRKRLAAAAGNAAVAAVPPPVATSIETAIYNTLSPGMDQNARFRTNNLYNNTHVIDLGDLDAFRGWANAIDGSFLLSANYRARSPQGRTRTSVPALGAEVLWNSGPAPMPPPASAPSAYVMSRDTLVWQGVGQASYQVATGNPGNDSCIGLVIRFNNFFYLTAGDLPLQGEDRIAKAVMRKVPPGNGLLPRPNRIASFKCGHHGSATSTSPAFLAAIQPTSALISCGYNDSYMHPDQAVIDLLDGNMDIDRFYLTNCIPIRAGVPGSQGAQRPAQIGGVPGNKSRVAGDNDHDNTAAWRVARGNILLSIGQAQSLLPAGAPGGRQYSVTFTNVDPQPALVAPVTEHINF
jgi:hypothetical protein